MNREKVIILLDFLKILRAIQDKNKTIEEAIDEILETTRTEAATVNA